MAAVPRGGGGDGGVGDALALLTAAGRRRSLIRWASSRSNDVFPDSLSPKTTR
ncbi:hypothetical protein AB0P40_01830 [Streptomyces sp. NPDC079189]|uniref:hypothetical protein n=1 Tax=Streptomyces sp. NPDC079189 TaxID=3154514 RepID=UPI003437ADF8